MSDVGAGEIRVLRRLEEAGGSVWTSDLDFTEETYLLGLRRRGWVAGFLGHGAWALTPEGRNFLADIPPLDLQAGPRPAESLDTTNRRQDDEPSIFQ